MLKKKYEQLFPKKIFYVSMGLLFGLLISNFFEYKSNIQVCFTPGRNCKDIIIKHIEDAKEEILVQSYSFTSTDIAEKLLKAKNRGVSVSILFDKSQLKAPYSKIPFLIENGITSKIDKVPGISHNKVMIIDNKTLITGSYNWTNAAELRNSENIIFIKDKKITYLYKENWKKLFFK
jgi:phospholipase D